MKVKMIIRGRVDSFKQLATKVVTWLKDIKCKNLPKDRNVKRMGFSYFMCWVFIIVSLIYFNNLDSVNNLVEDTNENLEDFDKTKIELVEFNDKSVNNELKPDSKEVTTSNTDTKVDISVEGNRGEVEGSLVSNLDSILSDLDRTESETIYHSIDSSEYIDFDIDISSIKEVSVKDIGIQTDKIKIYKDIEIQTDKVEAGKDVEIQTDKVETGKDVEIQTVKVETGKDTGILTEQMEIKEYSDKNIQIEDTVLYNNEKLQTEFLNFNQLDNTNIVQFIVIDRAEGDFEYILVSDGQYFYTEGDMFGLKLNDGDCIVLYNLNTSSKDIEIVYSYKAGLDTNVHNLDRFEYNEQTGTFEHFDTVFLDNVDNNPDSNLALKIDRCKFRVGESKIAIEKNDLITNLNFKDIEKTVSDSDYTSESLSGSQSLSGSTFSKLESDKERQSKFESPISESGS